MSELFRRKSDFSLEMSELFWKKSEIFWKISENFWKISEIIGVHLRDKWR